MEKKIVGLERMNNSIVDGTEWIHLRCIYNALYRTEWIGMRMAESLTYAYSIKKVGRKSAHGLMSSNISNIFI